MCSPASVLSNYRVSIHVSINSTSSFSTSQDVVVAVVAVVVVVASCHVDVERRFKADPHLFTLYFVTFRRVGQIDRAEDGRYGRGGVGRRLVVGETTACNGLERRIDFRRAIR